VAAAGELANAKLHMDDVQKQCSAAEAELTQTMSELEAVRMAAAAREKERAKLQEAHDALDQKNKEYKAEVAKLQKDVRYAQKEPYITHKRIQYSPQKSPVSHIKETYIAPKESC
jgi:chromosome segregation ATPase